MTADRAALKLDRFSYSYPGAVAPALDNVTLAIEPGEFVVVAGPSGAGKSTLLGVASGLIPHHHGGSASGEAFVRGRDLRDHNPASLAAVCGTVFQDPESGVLMSGVRAEIAFPLENAGQPPAVVARAVEETALSLGIDGLLDRRTDELSGGEAQRVALATALARRPNLLVLDEPTSQLDPVAGDELAGLLRRLNEEWGTTVIVADHRLERCLGLADRVVVVDAGSIVHDGTPRAFAAWAAARTSRRSLLPPVAQAFARAGLTPPPVSVKEARRRLAELDADNDAPGAGAATRGTPDFAPSGAVNPVLNFSGVSREHQSGVTAPCDLDLTLSAGERVALMGRNGVGKSTLLRIAKGLDRPTRGRVERVGEVALLMQNPNDYILHHRVADEAPPAALRAFGLGEFGDRDPRDLSGGERQRLALAIVMAARPAALLLDEPTRGMDRERMRSLTDDLKALAATGVAVMVATHDPEFAATFAQRVVLMGSGAVIADGPVASVLSGGWYFATEVARAFAGEPGVITVAHGAAAIERRLGARPRLHEAPR